MPGRRGTCFGISPTDRRRLIDPTHESSTATDTGNPIAGNGALGIGTPGSQPMVFLPARSVSASVTLSRKFHRFTTAVAELTFLRRTNLRGHGPCAEVSSFPRKLCVRALVTAIRLDRGIAALDLDRRAADSVRRGGTTTISAPGFYACASCRWSRSLDACKWERSIAVALSRSFASHALRISSCSMTLLSTSFDDSMTST